MKYYLNLTECLWYGNIINIQKSAVTGSQGDGAASPATSILQSTERVANVIGSTLSVNRNSFTISRPNLGMRSTVTDLSTQWCCKL